MTALKVSYSPPPAAEGVVTITMSENLAKKLLALFGRCNGGHFDELHNHLNKVLPERERLELMDPVRLTSATVDLASTTFIRK